MVRNVALAVIACSVGFAVPAGAQDTIQYKTGPWHYRSIPCVDTTVTSVTPRLATGGRPFSRSDFDSSGVEVSFNTALGTDPVLPGARAGVTHYQGTAGNAVMIAEHPGDRVQVCIVTVPSPTQVCDPDRDGRGRVYRVWDYRQGAQYNGMNSEHDCGGA